jgi:hypothetical protein
MRYLLTVVLMICAFAVLAQSKTTEDLQKNNKEAMSLFFYHNTLRMMNQDDDPEFDELIKDIEKLKFIMLDKKKTAGMDYNKLVKGYKSESFEEIMTSRFEGKNFDVFLKESGGITKGMVVTINDAENLFVLDIVGSIALNKITSFYKKLDESTELGKKIKDFTEKSK